MPAGRQSIKKGQHEKRYGQDGKNKDSTPSDNIIQGFVDIPAHDLFIVNQQDHAYQNDRQEKSVDNLGP